MTKRSFVRTISYFIFGITVLALYCVIATNNANTYKKQLEVGYQQSLTELNECLNSIETNLNKCMYSNSTGEIYDLSRDIYSECATAKNAISRLPVSQMKLQGTYKFLSQAGDYAIYIGDKLENNEKISADDQNSIFSLLGYAQDFTTATDDMVAIIESGGKITENQVISNTRDIDLTPLSNSFANSENTFDDYPTLLYDGPFADQIVNKKSVFLQNKDIKTKEECKTVAAKALGVSKDKITFGTDEESVINCYNFKCGRYAVCVTKNGGYVKSVLSSQMIKESVITPQQAVEYADDYLEKIGYDNMEESYYTVNNNICTINFAYEAEDTVYYTDLIKIGVSMTDGGIVSMDATTYLMNHTQRSDIEPSVNEETAKKAVSPYLAIKDAEKCVIPETNGKETPCWEFRCKSEKTGEDALVYINADTIQEEEILLLLYSDNGTLVK